MENLETEVLPVEFCASSDAQTTETSTQNSRLIEFPGVTRATVPGWRKEISERVREVQERRAREAAAEAAAAGTDADSAKLAPQLELLPQAEAPEINPLVAAALKRIERAHVETAPAYTQGRPVAAVAYALDQDFEGSGIETLPTGEIVDASYSEPEAFVEEEIEPPRTHNLVVVPPPTVVFEEQEDVRPKPRRVIGEDNPALNYLDSIETKIHIEDPTNRAPAFRRIIGGLVDLFVLALLCSPFVAGVMWMEADWRDPKVIVLAVATAVIVNFLYSTIMTALTGRTLGMRLLQLRVIDARTGLIPTGKQSAGRALLYLASFASAGIALMYALVDSEKRTAHDRFTQTAVIRA
jgi:uncharacterized RDD family membrane protein YckC